MELNTKFVQLYYNNGNLLEEYFQLNEIKEGTYKQYYENG
jgi:antitoxin component YwqK of YwqJK toxin-antitoxin module